MSSHAWINCNRKSKDVQDNEQDSGRVTLISCNPSNTKHLKTFTSFVRQSHKLLVSSDRDELQKPFFRQSQKKIADCTKNNLYDMY